VIPSPELAARLDRWRVSGLTLALGGGIACAAGCFSYPEQFDAAWLTAYFYWLGMALGMLAITLLHGMSGGAWGRAIRRVIEAGCQTLPLMAVLFLPVWLRVGQIYEWADPDVVRQSESLARKAGYLNVAGFQWRAILYFAVWIGSTWVIGFSSPNDEAALETPRSVRLQKHSGLCFVGYAFTMTLAAVDWIMSLEPEWYSTMYGLIHIAGQAVSGMSFALVVVSVLREYEPWSKIVTPDRLNDLGNLLLASVMFWAYCSFFQFLVIWSGNLPEENVWYVHRTQNGWEYLAQVLLVLHFAVPFLLLLSRQLKRQALDLGRIAALLLVMRYLDLYWLTVPGFGQSQSAGSGITLFWLDVAALAAIGGAWLAVFAWRLSVRVSVPMYDPEVTEKNDERVHESAA
jgi:hypothetical protein